MSVSPISQLRLRPALLLLFLMALPVLAAEPVPQSYVIDTERSWIRILVYRAGLLSGLGHNHVISSSQLSGEIGGKDGMFASITLPVASLVVDDPALRDLEGDDFPGHVSDKDIRGTRENMLGRKLLNAVEFPDIVVETADITGTSEALQVHAKASVRDFAGEFAFQATAVTDGERVSVDGTAQVSHRDLGLKRFSAAFGTLKVADEMTIRFHLEGVATIGDN